MDTPSCATSQERIADSAVKVAKHRPQSRSHTFRAPSLEAEMAYLPSGVTATALTQPRVWGQVIQGLEEVATVLADCPTGDRRGLAATRVQALL
jgi:hypothetical protein